MMDEDETNVPEIAGKIAAELGDGWSLDVRNPWGEGAVTHCAFLRRADGLALFVSGGRWNERGRLRVSLDVPNEWTDHKRYDEPTPEISVSASKEPRLTARDILRRLVPDAETLFTALRDRAEKSDAAEKRREGVLLRIREAWGGPTHDLPGRTRNVESVRLGGFAAHPVSGSARPLHGGAEVAFEIRVSAVNAIKLAGFLATLREG